MFSSNLNAQSKKQVIFTSFLLPKKRFFFLVQSQFAILESSIFTIFMYFYFLQKPRTALLEQLSRILPSDSDTLPDQLILANTCDRQVLFSILFIILEWIYIYFKNISDFFFIFTGSPFGSQIGRLWPQSYLHCGTSRCQSNSNLSCCQNTKILQHQNPKSSTSQGMQKKLYCYFFPKLNAK